MTLPPPAPAMRVPYVAPSLIAIVFIFATARMIAALAQMDIAGLIAGVQP